MSAIIKDILITILQVLIPIVVGYVGIGCKKIYAKFIDNDTKRKISESVVLFVEQTCKNLHGKEKFDEAKKSFVKLLNEKGIPFTETEIDILIEGAVGEFNKATK